VSSDHRSCPSRSKDVDTTVADCRKEDVQAYARGAGVSVEDEVSFFLSFFSFLFSIFARVRVDAV
jgi:hypothetical protein